MADENKGRRITDVRMDGRDRISFVLEAADFGRGDLLHETIRVILENLLVL